MQCIAVKCFIIIVAWIFFSFVLTLFLGPIKIRIIKVWSHVFKLWNTYTQGRRGGGHLGVSKRLWYHLPCKSAFKPSSPSGRSLSRWREALWELSVLPKNNTMIRPGLVPGPLAPESSALTMRPPCLPPYSASETPQQELWQSHLGWSNTVFARAFADAIQRANISSRERSFYLLNTRTICVIFLYNWTQCIDGFGLSLQRHVRKGNDAKNPAILSFCLLPKELSWMQRMRSCSKNWDRLL